MKKTLIVLLSVIVIGTVISQNIKKQSENVKLDKISFPIEAQIKIIEEMIMSYYGKSYENYEGIRSGIFKFKYDSKKNANKLYVVDSKNGKIIDEINIEKQRQTNGVENLVIADNEFNKLIPYEHGNITNSITTLTSLIQKTNILTDKNILENEEISSTYWKILNRTMTNYLDDQDGNDLDLFVQCRAGKIIPYDGGINSKLITVDNLAHSIVYFNTDFGSSGEDEPVNQVYGHGGQGTGEFFNPSGIALGREYESHGNYVYPVFIADYNNSRIVLLDYMINTSYSGLGSFDGFSVFKQVMFPNDVVYFKGEEAEDDKIWVSQTTFRSNTLLVYKTDGHLYNRFIGYKDDSSGTTFYFNASDEMRLGIYNQGFPAISFINKNRNALVTCLLNSDGSPNYFDSEDPENGGNIIIAEDIIHFPSSDPINSVSYQRTYSANNLWPNVWVTSPSNIHLFKMNKSAHLAYMASTYKPRNTTSNFNELLNTMTVDDYYNILTIEKWDYVYGIRKYWPYCDRYNDSLYNYCNDSLDVIRYKATFTNDCWLYMTAKRKKIDGSWEKVNIKRFNGSDVNDTFYVKYQLAGWNQNSSDLFIDLQLDLPIEDYALGNQVKVVVRMFPEYIYPIGNLSSSERVDKEYTAEVNKYCLPRPGGCPFLYYKDYNTNDYYADNNILSKSEYSGSNDITDRYKFIKTPKIEGTKMGLALVENESDNSSINMVKIYAVDYPSDKRVAITDNNYIILYDSSTVIASDSVILNGLQNITTNVNFHNPGVPVDRYKLDSIYAHFTYPSLSRLVTKTEQSNNSNNSLEKSRLSKDKTFGPGGPQPTIAFIGEIGNLFYPIATLKDTGGVLSSMSIYSNTTAKMFSRREKSSVVVLPLFFDSNKVDNFTIKWQSDYHLKTLGVTTIDYGNFFFNEIPMEKASFISSTLDSEITSSVTEIDTNFGLVNSSGIIKMNFDLSGLPSIPSHHLRAYVIEVNGHYSSPSDFSKDSKENTLPTIFSLSQNYPNPFNPITKINYELPKNTKVKIIIYDILGREVTKLVNNELKQAGRYSVEFDGKNFASGVYFYRIEAGSFVQAKKMVLVK